MERFVGILIEHFEGAFPTWLAPTQVVVTTISEKSAEYGRKVCDDLKAAGLRAELDDSAEKIGPKKHRARQMKVPYIAVVGEQEAAASTVNVNPRDGGESRTMPLDRFMAMVLEENKPAATGRK